MSESWGYTPSEPVQEPEQSEPLSAGPVDAGQGGEVAAETGATAVEVATDAFSAEPSAAPWSTPVAEGAAEAVAPEAAESVVPDVAVAETSDPWSAPVPDFGAPAVPDFGSVPVADFGSASVASFDQAPAVPTDSFGVASAPIPVPTFDAAPAPYTPPEPSVYTPVDPAAYTPAPNPFDVSSATATPLGGDAAQATGYQDAAQTPWQPTPAPAPQPGTAYAWAPDPATAQATPPQGYPVYNAGAPQAGYTAAQYPEPYVGSAAAVQNLVPGQVVQTAFGPIMVGQKSKLAAGLLGIFLGSLGIGRFYRGFTGLGVAQLAVTIVTCGVGALWGFIEGIMVLVAQPGTDMSKDAQGYLMSS